MSRARPDLQKSASNWFMYAVLLVMATGMLLLASAGYRIGHVPQQSPGQPAQPRIG